MNTRYLYLPIVLLTTTLAAGYIWLNMAITDEYEKAISMLGQMTGISYERTKDQRGITSAYIETSGYVSTVDNQGKSLRKHLLTIEHWIDYGPWINDINGNPKHGLAGIQSIIRPGSDVSKSLPDEVTDQLLINAYTVIETNKSHSTQFESQPFEAFDTIVGRQIYWGGLNGFLEYSTKFGTLVSELDSAPFSIANKNAGFSLSFGESKCSTEAKYDTSGLWVGANNCSIGSLTFKIRDQQAEERRFHLDDISIKDDSKVEEGLLHGMSLINVSGIEIGELYFDKFDSELKYERFDVKTIMSISENINDTGALPADSAKRLATSNPSITIDHIRLDSFGDALSINGKVSIKPTQDLRTSTSKLPASLIKGVVTENSDPDVGGKPSLIQGAGLNGELTLTLDDGMANLIGRGAATPYSDDGNALQDRTTAQIFLDGMVQSGWITHDDGAYRLRAVFTERSLKVNGKDGAAMIGGVIASMMMDKMQQANP